MQREVVRSPSLGPELGMYSHVFSVDLRSCSRLVVIAGQTATNAQGHMVGVGDFRAQFQQVYANLQAAVEAAGGTLASVIQLRTFLTRSEDIASFHECRRNLYPTVFPDGVYPPNTLLVVNRLVMPELLLEIEALAAI